jgi:CHAT domain-containing protein
LNAFRGAIREGRGDVDDLGRELYTELMGELGAEERAKPNWLLSLGDALLDLPFAALVEERGSDKKEKKYLIEQHSLQIVPGASLLKRTGTPSTRGAMLAVGDPVYNTADPRWTGVRRMTFSGWTARAETAGQLARLVASSTEVESSARSWQPERSMVLEGSQARRNPFLDAIREQPAVIHLATHMILPPGRRSDAMIAFGIDDPGQPELLSSAEVSRLHVPGAVVVMTGCDSGAGEIRAGAGLFGLTRAWEMAGAGAVIDTRWPVRDSKGEIFASFYRHLRTESTADALRNSQIEMIHSGTWRAGAAYWASYRLTGSER